MEIVLDRKYKKETYTIGVITVDGKYVCNSVEDKDYGFNQDTPVKTIKDTKAKHPQQVAIPAGRYEVSVKYYRGMADKYPFYKNSSCKGHIPCLVNVPGYSGILIHCGSTAKDSAGCIIVGKNTIKGGVTESRACFTKLCDMIMAAAGRKEKVYITIR